MPLIRLLIVAIAALSFQSISYAGQYYVCTDANGKKLFTSNPCPEDQAATTKSYKPSTTSTNSAQSSRVNLEDNESYQSMRDNNRRLELKRNIKKSESNLQSFEARRDNELARLRLKKNSANNNAAGAIWLQSISTEMGTVNDRYKSKIESEQRKLDRMLNELSGLE
tara:strand:- start:34477 stop:34977 length:501 start_codon:yes stop_codon:yes gene_type:complete